MLDNWFDKGSKIAGVPRAGIGMKRPSFDRSYRFHSGQSECLKSACVTDSGPLLVKKPRASVELVLSLTHRAQFLT